MLNPGQIPFVMYVAVLGDQYGQTGSILCVSTSANVIELLRSRSCPSAYSWKALLPGWRRDDPLRLSRKHHRIRPSAASCVSFDLYLAVEWS